MNCGASCSPVINITLSSFVGPEGPVGPQGPPGTVGGISTIELFSSLAGLGTLGYISTSQLTSTVAGLGTAGYLSSINWRGIVSTANLANLVSTSYFTSQLTSTVIGLGSAGYVSSSMLTSTVIGYQGNTLVVDSVFGNDILAFANPYAIPFSTLSTALYVAGVATSNLNLSQNVKIRAGRYNESIIIPPNVTVSGANTQSVVIQKLNVLTDTTLITMGSNSRLENITGTLTSGNTVNLIGVDYPGVTTTNAKIRTAVINVSSFGAADSPSTIGIYSGGNSSTAYSSVNPIARTTINTFSQNTGLTRGIYVTGSNRFSIRESIVYTNGTGGNVVGTEINNQNGVLDIKTTSVFGNLFDVNRQAGTLYIGMSDLQNNTSGCNSFTPALSPPIFQYGAIGNLAKNTRYYLASGTVAIANLNPEARANPYDATSAHPLTFSKGSIVIFANCAFTGSLDPGNIMTFYVYKNNTAPPLMSSILTNTTRYDNVSTTSINFRVGDILTTTLETGSNTAGTARDIFIGTLGYY